MPQYSDFQRWKVLLASTCLRRISSVDKPPSRFFRMLMIC